LRKSAEFKQFEISTKEEWQAEIGT